MKNFKLPTEVPKLPFKLPTEVPKLPTFKSNNPQSMGPKNKCENLTSNVKKTNAVINKYCEFVKLEDPEIAKLNNLIKDPIPNDIITKYTDECNDTLIKIIKNNIAFYFSKFFNYPSRQQIYNNLKPPSLKGGEGDDFKVNDSFKYKIDKIIEYQIKLLFKKVEDDKSNTESFKKDLHNFLTNIINSYITTVIDKFKFKFNDPIYINSLLLDSLNDSDIFLERNYFKLFIGGGEEEKNCYVEFANKFFEQSQYQHPKVKDTISTHISNESTNVVILMQKKIFSKILKAINNEIYSFFKKDCLLHMKEFILKNHSSTITGGGGSDEDIFDKMTSITNNKKNIKYYYEKLIDNIIISNRDFLINKTTDEINTRYQIDKDSPMQTTKSPFNPIFEQIFMKLYNLIKLVEPIQRDYLIKNKSNIKYLIKTTLKGGKRQKNTKTKKNKNHIKQPKYFK